MPFETAFVDDTVHGLLVAVRLDDAADDDGLAHLHEDERALAATWALKRRRTWAGGRIALRRALALRGFDDDVVRGVVTKDDRGAPVLPRGALGSISHKDELAVALVDTAGAGRVGVDVEPLARRSVDVARHVLTPREIAELAGLDEDARARATTVRFSAKEALYKALDPYVRRYVGFQEVEARPDASFDAGGEGGHVRSAGVAFTLALAKGGEGPFYVEGRATIRGGVVVTTVRVVATR